MHKLKLPEFSNLVTPLLIVLLVVSAFLIGMFWTKVQMLEKGTAGQSTQAETTPAAPAPAPTALSSEKFEEVVRDAILVSGDENAPVKLVEFSDFECPFCGRFYSETLGQVEEEYVKTGKVAYYYRHFPLYSIHPSAEGAALASECAREQGKFREMHDAIFENQTKISTSDLKGYAADLGFNTTQFNSCLDSKKYQENVDRDVALGGEIGVGGTPTFFVNGKIINGAQPFPVFQTTIEDLLGS